MSSNPFNYVNGSRGTGLAWLIGAPTSCITAGPKSVSTGNGQPIVCAMVLQPVPISCHFRVVKSPLSRIVSGAITSELLLTLLNRNVAVTMSTGYQEETVSLWSPNIAVRADNPA